MKRAPKTGRTRARTSDVIGADETAVRVKGEKTIVGVAADAATGQVWGLDVPVECDSDGFADRLRDYARGFGVEAMVTDDLNTYKPAVERLGIEHQICVARAVMPSQAAGRSVDKQRDGACDREKQDKVQDGQGGTRAKTGC